MALVAAAPAQVGGVDQGGPRRIELRDEGVGAATVCGLQGGAGNDRARTGVFGTGGEVGGTRIPCHVGIAGGVHGNA